MTPGAPPLVDDQAPAGAAAGEPPRPTSYKNPEHVRLVMERCRNDAAHNPARLERDSQDILNHKMYRGGPRNQWVWRNPHSGMWEERPYTGADGLPAWVPRCVTNDFANKIDGIVSIFVQSDPAKTARPATDDDDDRAAAEVAERALPVLEDEIGWPSLKRRLSHLVALQDKAALVVYYDNDPKYGTEDLPIYVCRTCEAGGADPYGGLREAPDIDEAGGVCPECGGETLEEFINPQTNLAEGLTYATGRMCADLVNSFGFSLPSNATACDAQRLPWVLLHDEMDIEQACRTWGDHVEAIRNAGQHQGSSQVSRQYAQELRTLSAPTTRTGAAGLAGGVSDRAKNVVLVYRLQHDPIVDETVNFPDGLYAVMVADQVLEAGPLPVKDEQTGQRRKSILIRTYREMPGTPFGKPPADDLVPLQMQQNLLETLAFMTAMHHAAPTVFLPTAVTLEDELTGMPGQTVRYRSHDPQQKPSREQGTGVHSSVFELLARYEQKMDQLSGLNAVLQGARPKEGGNPTLGEVQILQERGMAAFRTPLEVAVDFERELAKLLLDIARQSIWSKRFRRVMGENGQWDVQQFTGADLRGHVDIVIEPMSAWPKSPMMQDLRLGRAVEFGVIAPPQDAELAAKMLDMYGLTELKPSLNADKKQVARELDRWRAARGPQDIPPPNLAVIEPPIHLFLKKQFLKTEEAEQIAAANPAVYQAMVAHVQQLQMALMPPAPADPNAPPDGSAVEAAVQAGVLEPEGAQGDPMQAAVEAGVLMPEQPQGPTGPSIDDLMAAEVLAPAPPEHGPGPPA